jgi:Tubulin-tyrosine ligase family
LKWSTHIEWKRRRDDSYDSSYSIDEKVLDLAIKACRSFLELKRSGSEETGENQAGIKADISPVKSSLRDKMTFSKSNSQPATLGTNSAAVSIAEESEIEVSLKTLGLTESEWQSILITSYYLASHTEIDTVQELFTLPTQIKAAACELSNRGFQILLLQNALRSYRKQFRIDGFKNIWIVKAPDVSRGVGMQLLYRLDDILECEKGMGCRTVQKYIESPLLALCNQRLVRDIRSSNKISYSITRPRSSPGQSRNPCLTVNQQQDDSTKLPKHSKKRLNLDLKNKPESHPSDPLTSRIASNAKAKFDLRVWVLVTSFEPSDLKAYVYTAVYGRRCRVPYTGCISQLNDNLVHLTNYSIQKKGPPGVGVGVGVGSRASPTRSKSFQSATSGTRSKKAHLKGDVRSYGNPLQAVRSLRSVSARGPPSGTGTRGIGAKSEEGSSSDRDHEVGAINRLPPSSSQVKGVSLDPESCSLGSTSIASSVPTPGAELLICTYRVCVMYVQCV